MPWYRCPKTGDTVVLPYVRKDTGTVDRRRKIKHNGTTYVRVRREVASYKPRQLP